jgi:hypothetical protein
VLAQLIPELRPTIDFNQESKYHDDTLDEHIIKVVENAAKLNAPLEVRLAALFHDSGKPDSAFRGEDGRLHYYGRPAAPAPDHEVTLPPALAGEVAYLIGETWADGTGRPSEDIRLRDKVNAATRYGKNGRALQMKLKLAPDELEVLRRELEAESDGYGLWGEEGAGMRDYRAVRAGARRVLAALPEPGGVEEKPDHQDRGAEIAREALTRLRYPNATISRVARIVQNHMVEVAGTKRPAKVRKWRAEVGPDIVPDLLLHRRADVTTKEGAGSAEEQLAQLNRLQHLLDTEKGAPADRSDLTITGSDLIALGIPPGPEVGAILRSLLDQVIADPSLNRRDWLLAQAARLRSGDAPLNLSSFRGPEFETVWRALPDNTRVWLFHANSYPDTHAGFIRNGIDPAVKPPSLARQRYLSGEQATFAPGSGVGAGLYVSYRPSDVGGYGRHLIAVHVRKGDVAVPPEQANLGATDAAQALRVGDGIVNVPIPPENIVEVGDPGREPDDAKIAAQLAKHVSR